MKVKTEDVPRTISGAGGNVWAFRPLFQQLTKMEPCAPPSYSLTTVTVSALPRARYSGRYIVSTSEGGGA